MKRSLSLAAILILVLLHAPALDAESSGLKFEVTVAAGLLSSPQDGRLFVVMSRRSRPEPRLTIGQTGLDASPMFGRDVKHFSPGATGIIDETCAAFPIDNLARVPAGDYFVQALFDSNIDLKSVNAPGNLFSKPIQVHFDPAHAGSVKIELTEKIPPEQLPPDTEYVKYVKIQSDLLSKFHGRPIYLRAGVILPRGFESDRSTRYPLRVRIDGYGDRFTSVQTLMREGSGFRSVWLADSAPRMVFLQLDGDGPYGDCYQVNSENNGPYGDAVTQELIPYVEKTFRCIGQPWARVLDGGSTGGWVSLALQVFYPDFFNGTWSGFPDGVDFRAFELINIYEDANAYVNNHGFERPSARDLNGDVRFTIRHECQMENVMGASDSYTMSGQQWGAWNATYGPRAADGRPAPLWDPKTGIINRRLVEHWKKYDLRLVLEQNWKTLGPKLRGKLTIWVGEADEYFLNNAVHMLDAFLTKADPPYEGKIMYGPGKGHGWTPFSEREIMDQMSAAIEKARR
ncbi:MAG TPA: alpha/beta hydrolase-fold protein [Blastocatellia bacterium]|nr:alpha/beta hydrolase-fold protein [Blastocatellia bacterium]